MIQGFFLKIEKLLQLLIEDLETKKMDSKHFKSLK